jgi:imidazolonepropionase-like amidohydrolase
MNTSKLLPKWWSALSSTRSERLGDKPLHLWFTMSLFAASLAHASTVTPARRPAAPVLLRGGEVHTVSGAVLAKTDVLMADGRIAQIGAGLKAPVGAEVIDVTGRRVYPGLISASTTLGLEEIGAVPATVDTTEIGAINPNARAQVAVNPDSELIPVTRANGVLTVLTTPTAQNGEPAAQALLAGTSALLRLDGWTWEDMTLRAAVGLHVYWPAPAEGRRRRGEPDETKKRLDEQLKTLRTAFASARAYLRAKDAAAGKPTDTDLRWEAMLPALRREMPVFVHADDVKQIGAALDWAGEENVKMILVGGRDAWRLADRLKAADVAVIVGGVFSLPARRDDGYDDIYANAGKLHAAGVRFCMATSGGTAAGATNGRNLPYEAGMAAAFGLPADEALKAITLYPAQILGVAGELGSIEPGKRATLIVTDGDPLEIPTQVLMAFIDGGRIDLHSRHTGLYEKYRRRYAK